MGNITAVTIMFVCDAGTDTAFKVGRFLVFENLPNSRKGGKNLHLVNS